ncbi:MAG: hypothetical protein WCI53_11005 [Bacteroidota bacterium]
MNKSLLNKCFINASIVLLLLVINSVKSHVTLNSIIDPTVFCKNTLTRSLTIDKIKNTGLSDKLSLTINCLSTSLNVRLSNSVNKSGLVSFAEISATASVSGIAVYSTNLVNLIKTKI